MTFTWLVPAFVGYAIGSVPWGWLFVRAATGRDLRLVGSRNVGAANALRQTRWQTAVVVVGLDMIKGAAAVAAGGVLDAGLSPRCVAGVAAVVGHVYPVWLGFRGGKGVAASAGVFAMLAPSAALLSIGTFVTVVAGTRFVSVGSLGASAVLLAALWAVGAADEVVGAASVAVSLITWRHRGNIERLFAGNEPHLGSRPGARFPTESQ